MNTATDIPLRFLFGEKPPSFEKLKADIAALDPEKRSKTIYHHFSQAAQNGDISFIQDLLALTPADLNLPTENDHERSSLSLHEMSHPNDPYAQSFQDHQWLIPQLIKCINPHLENEANIVASVTYLWSLELQKKQKINLITGEPTLIMDTLKAACAVDSALIFEIIVTKAKYPEDHFNRWSRHCVEDNKPKVLKFILDHTKTVDLPGVLASAWNFDKNTSEAAKIVLEYVLRNQRNKHTSRPTTSVQLTKPNGSSSKNRI